MLIIQDLKVQYGDNSLILDGFELSVGQGEIIGIVGESGSGKTTVIRSILGALPQNATMTAKKLELCGESLLEKTTEDWRKLRGTDISMIFQDSVGSFNPVRKIGTQFIEYIRTHRKMSKKDATHLAEEMLRKVHLQEPSRIINSYPFQLSGGMMQRVSIAMAMTFQPKLLLADEPTSALDVTTQAQIVEQMMELRKEYNTSIIMVTHNVGVAAHMADRLIVMKNGIVVDQGSTNEVLSNPQSEYTKQLLQAVPDMEGERYV